MTEIKVEQIIQGTLIREGGGVKLQRYIGAERDNPYEPILLLDYFDSHDPLDYMAGFPAHPHRGFETITYLLHGTITHEDNKGNKGVIGPGDVQWMTAGKGIIHSEMPSSSTGHLMGLQLWMNLPAAKKMTEPRYHDRPSADFPLEQQDSGVVVKVIAGSTNKGTSSPISGIATNPLFFDIQLPKNSEFCQQIAADYQVILFVLDGEIEVGTDVIGSKQLAALSAGDSLRIKSKAASQCLLVAAQKLHEPIARYGPFVMNTQEEIMQALADFRSNSF